MMFFERLVLWVGNFLPEYSKFTWHFCLVFNHEECKQKVIAWHKAELEKLDIWYGAQQESFRLVSARERARAVGISPLDPRYPERLSGSMDLWRSAPHLDVKAIRDINRLIHAKIR